MGNDKSMKEIIEALLIVSGSGLSVQELQTAMPEADRGQITEGIETLRNEYTGSGRAFNIAEIAGKFRIVTHPDFMGWINNLYRKDVDRLTGPTLETLAILAYKQPSTRAEIEAIRGVNVGGILRSLLDKELIQVKGRKDALGRPLLYGTTGKFLEIFGLKSLDDLPALRDFSEEDLDLNRTPENTVVDTGGDEGPEAGGDKGPDPSDDGGQGVEDGTPPGGIVEEEGAVDSCAVDGEAIKGSQER